MSCVEVLRAARKLIERPGTWGKGHAEHPPEGDCHCMLTALARSGSQARVDDARALLESITGAREFSLHRWNDAPETTHADVLAAFDRAIQLAESGAA